MVNDDDELMMTVDAATVAAENYAAAMKQNDKAMKDLPAQVKI